MAIEILGSGQPDGTGVVRATTEKLHLYGGTAVSQAVTIADVTEVTASDTAELVTDLAALEAKFNILLSDLSDLGITAA